MNGFEPVKECIYQYTDAGQYGVQWDEEIVRCRDCIYCKEAINGKALCERFSMEGSWGTLYPTVEWDGFCKWGERRNA